MVSQQRPIGMRCDPMFLLTLEERQLLLGNMEKAGGGETPHYLLLQSPEVMNEIATHFLTT